MKIIDKSSFNVIDNENIIDFIKYYGVVSVNEDEMLELKLNFDDLSRDCQLALIRYQDEEYEETLIDNNFDELDKSSLTLLLNSKDYDDLIDARLTLEKDISDLAIKLYKNECQDLIDFMCVKISEEEQSELDEGLKYADF